MPDYDLSRSPAAPIAKVNIREPKIGGVGIPVEMLVDTGADISVIPRVIASKLKLSPISHYEAQDFEGQRHDLESFEARISFEGRGYIGEYLVHDAPTGILGRDILNELRLLLDGPNANWEILP